MADVRGDRFRSTSSGSRVSDPGRHSQKTGTNPFHTSACAVAANVNDGTMTSDPAGSSIAWGASMSPAVHEETAIAWVAPVCRHTSSSKARTMCPVVTCPSSQLARTRSSTSRNCGSVGRMIGIMFRSPEGRGRAGADPATVRADAPGSARRPSRDASRLADHGGGLRHVDGGSRSPVREPGLHGQYRPEHRHHRPELLHDGTGCALLGEALEVGHIVCETRGRQLPGPADPLDAL